MKIILNRKGFDSQFGKQAIPILLDGTLLSMPIPSYDLLTELRKNGVKKGDLFLVFGWFKQTEYHHVMDWIRYLFNKNIFL